MDATRIDNNLLQVESQFSEIHCSENKHRTRSLLWRFFNFLMAVFYGLAAYVQLNDPDSVTWVIVYGIPCVLCCSLVVSVSLQGHIVWRGVAISHCVGCVAGGLFIIVIMESQLKELYNPLELEEGRELCGLLIVIVWLMFCIIPRSFHGLNLPSWSLAVVVCIAPLLSWMYYYKTMSQRNLATHCKDML